MLRRTRFLTAGLVAAVVVAALVAATTGSDDDSDGAPVDGHTFLSAPYVTFDGDTLRLDEIDGPLVVNFFASWCTPCIVEMPEFETVHQELGDQVTFVGLNYDDTVKKGLEIIERTEITYDVGRDVDGKLFRSVKGLQLPTTVFVRADGTVAKVHMMQLSEERLRSLIRDELGVGA